MLKRSSNRRRREGDLDRRDRRGASVVSSLAVGILWVLASTASASVEILPLAEVRAGMKGVGRTVFSGETIEEFGVEIVGVLPQSRPQGSLILFRGEGAELRRTGIIAGMSGSPVYVDGRLIGAVAFAYPMVKEPIGAITPIEEMLDLGLHADLPAEEAIGQEAGPLSLRPDARPTGRPGTITGQAGTGGQPDGTTDAPERFAALWSSFLDRLADSPATIPDRSPLPLVEPKRDRAGASLRPLTLPVAMTGWALPVLSALSGSLVELGLEPGIGPAPAGAGISAETEASGEAGRGDAHHRPLQPGSALGISHVTGAAAKAAIGTVTMVDGDRVFAFGHPMLNGGPVGLPLWRARILTVMPSVEVSFKLGSVTAPIGGIWQDRRAGVYGTLGPVPEMIPVRVVLRGLADEPLVYRYQVARDRMMTAFLLPWTIANSWLHTGWNTGEIAARCRVRVDYNGGRVVRREEMIRTDVPALGLSGAATLPAALLLVNPFERARLASLWVEIDAERRQPPAYVTGLRADRARVRVGESIRCTARLETWRADPESVVFQVRARPEWAGRRIRLLAASAAEVMEMDRERTPGRFTPRSLAQLVSLVETLPGSEVLLLRVMSREAGAVIDGREISSLPPSLAAAGTSTGARAMIRSAAGSLLEEHSQATDWILSGAEWMELEVIP